MSVTERVAYLKGLFDGLEMDTTKKEGKVFAGILEVLEELANTVSDLETQNRELMDEMDDLYEDFAAMHEDFMTDDEAMSEDEDEELYQVICPTCAEIIYLDDVLLEQGSMVCGSCGEDLEFDISDLSDDEK